MAITAADVNKLRKMTGAGMMDCKKALEASNGDFDAAIDFLRKKGQKVAAKRADREATEGVVIAQTNEAGNHGVVLYVTSETDFVAKNNDFIAFAHEMLELAIEKNATDKVSFLDEVSANGITVAKRLEEQIGIIGEKIEIAELETIDAPTVVSYIHAGNKAAVIVGMNQEANDAIIAAGKDVAMQIAAMKPIAVSADDVEDSVLDKEREIGREKALAEGKPEHIVDKIVEGSVQKFLKENTLLSQKFVKDSSMHINEYLASVSSGLTVTEFKRVSL